MKLYFDQSNTKGYTDEQLLAFNAEYDQRIALAGGGVVEYERRVEIFTEMATTVTAKNSMQLISEGTATAFHVGSDAYTVEVVLMSGHLAYHGPNGQYPYFSEDDALELAKTTNAAGVIDSVKWVNGDGYPLNFDDGLRRELEAVREQEDEHLFGM